MAESCDSSNNWSIIVHDTNGKIEKSNGFIARKLNSSDRLLLYRYSMNLKSPLQGIDEKFETQWYLFPFLRQ